MKARDLPVSLEVVSETKQFQLSQLVPLNLLSQITGALSRLQLPGAAGKILVNSFARIFRIDMREAEHPMDAYLTIEDIFTRALKPGSRVVEGPVCSPCDGFLSISGSASEGQAVQAKGIKYSLPSLVFGSEQTESKSFNHYTTIYLAPHNYHRVHSPVNGQLEKMRYIPGELWPVNEPFVRFTPRLFVRNERLVFDIREEKSGGLVHVVMVGALNVGRISTPFWPGMFTNTKDARVKYLRTERQKSAAHHLLCGQEIGTFMLGSTVVIVWDKKVSEYYNLKNQTEKSKIQLGDALLD